MRVKIKRDTLTPEPWYWIIRESTSNELTVGAPHINQEQAPNDITLKELGLIKDVLSPKYLIEIVI